MSINKTIDQIVEAFISEMTKISKTNESEEQKERSLRSASTTRGFVLRLATGSPSSSLGGRSDATTPPKQRPGANLMNICFCKILVTHASEIVPANL
jgi:hypothetical protein